MNKIYTIISLAVFSIGFFTSLSANATELFFRLNSKDLKKMNCKLGKAEVKYERNKTIFTGGGKNEQVIIPLKNKFPVNQGTVEFFYKFNIPSTGKEIVLFDALGTPRWWDRFIVSIKPLANGLSTITLTVCETNRNVYAGRPIFFTGKIDSSKWQHIAFTWENINSKKPDVKIKLYLNGILVGQRENHELSVKDNAKEIMLCGGHSPMPTGSSKCLSMKSFAIWKAPLSPAEIMTNSKRKYSWKKQVEKSFALIYEIKGKVPVIDGVISKDEWRNFQGLGPFSVYHKNSKLADWQTNMRIGYKGSKIYVSWKAFCNGNPTGKALKQDGILWTQDSVELFFSPDGKKIVHFIGNARSSVYDEISYNAGKEWDRTWNNKWNYKSSIQQGVWTGELVFDCNDLGFTKPEEGKQWIFNSCRNGFTPHILSMWNYSQVGFLDPAGMGGIGFAKEGIIVNSIDFDQIIAGGSSIGFTVTNPAKKPEALLLAISAKGKKDNVETSALLTSDKLKGGNFTFDYSISKPGSYKSIFTIVDSENNKAILIRPMTLKVKLPLQLTFDKYFYKGFVDLTINAKKLTNVYSNGILTVKNEAGKVFFTENFNYSPISKIKIKTKDFPAGKYLIVVSLKDKLKNNMITRKKTLEVYNKPVCISATTGTENYTAPWGKLKLAKQTISCWNRKYVFDNTLFPKEMYTAGENILAGTPKFIYKLNGISYSIKKCKFKIDSSNSELIVASIFAKDDNLYIKGKINIEYDGAIIYKLKIAALKNIMFDSLVLNIPLRNKDAKYLFYSNELSYNKKKSRVPTEYGKSVNFPFIPMFGIGSVKRSLFWFCESDEGWLPYDRDNCITVKRNKNNVTLKLSILQNSKITKPLSMSCGFICGPIKPVKYNADDHRIFHFWPGGPYFSTAKVNYEKFNLKKAKELGTKIIGVHEWWTKYYGSLDAADNDALKRFVKKAHKLGMKVLLYKSALGNKQAPSQAYFGDMWLSHPVAGFSKHSGNSRKGMTGQFRCSAADNYIDWYVGGCKRILKDFGVDGFYYDFTVFPCYNEKHGCGYIAKASKKSNTATATIGVDYLNVNTNINRRPTWPILKHRKLWQRMYNMVKKELGPSGIINAHLSETNGVIFWPFVDTIIHSEFAANYIKEIPSPEDYRVFFSKAYMGLPGNAIFHNLKNGFNKDYLSVSLLHREWYRPCSRADSAYLYKPNYEPVTDVWKTFDKFKVDSAKWFPYWEKQNHVKVAPVRKVYCSYWKRNNELLLVVSNISKTKVNANIQLKSAGLYKTTAKNAVSGKAISMKNQKISISLAPHEYKLILVKNGNSPQQ